MMLSDIDCSKLNVEEAEQMSMSIRPSSSGLTFVIYEGQHFQGKAVEGFLPIDASPNTWADRISDLFYKHSFLALPFHRVKLLFEPVEGLLIPKELYQENFESLWLSYLNSEEELVGIKEDIDNEDKSFLFYYPKALLHFLKRTHLRLETVSYFKDLIAQAQLTTREQASRSLNLSLRLGVLDCYLVDKGSVQFYNRFPIVESQNQAVIEGEVMYYLFMLIRELDLNLETDTLNIQISTAEDEATQKLLQATVERLEGNLEERIKHYKKIDE